MHGFLHRLELLFFRVLKIFLDSYLNPAHFDYINALDTTATFNAPLFLFMKIWQHLRFITYEPCRRRQKNMDKYKVVY